MHRHTSTEKLETSFKNPIIGRALSLASTEDLVRNLNLYDLTKTRTTFLDFFVLNPLEMVNL